MWKCLVPFLRQMADTRNDFCQNLQPSKPWSASCLPILGLSPCLASTAPNPQYGQDIPRAILVARPAGRRLGKALPEPKLETRAQAPIHPKSSSTVRWLLRTNNRSFESSQAFSGRQGPTLQNHKDSFEPVSDRTRPNPRRPLLSSGASPYQ